MPILKVVDWKQRALRALDPVLDALPRAPLPAAWRTPDRILFLNIWAVGDVVLNTPALQALRAAFPHASITMLGQPHAKELLAGAPWVDEVLVGAIPWVRKTGKYDPRAYLAPDFRATLAELRARRFDLALDGQMDPRGNLLLALSGARRRVGFAEHGWGRMLTDAPAFDATRPHTVQASLQLVEHVAGPVELPPLSLPVDPARALAMRTQLAQRGIKPSERVVVVHPGAGNPVRRWGLDRFAEVVRAIADAELRCRPVVLAEPGGYGRELEAAGATVLSLSLRDVVALLSLSDVFFGADNGPMHIATAVGARAVGLYGPTSLDWYGPWGNGHRTVKLDPMPCRPCGDRCLFHQPYCMNDLPVSTALAALRDALATTGQPRWNA